MHIAKEVSKNAVLPVSLIVATNIVMSSLICFFVWKNEILSFYLTLSAGPDFRWRMGTLAASFLLFNLSFVVHRCVRRGTFAKQLATGGIITTFCGFLIRIIALGNTAADMNVGSEFFFVLVFIGSFYGLVIALALKHSDVRPITPFRD